MNVFERMHECVGVWTDDGVWQVMPGEPIVRCKECAHMKKNPLVGCGCICEYFGFTLPDRDGFCSWAEPREEES